MSAETICAEGLSKAYRIGLREELQDTLVGAAQYWLSSPLRNFRRLRRLNTFDFREGSDDVIWALRDVSFAVPDGEVLGVIGRNGAGKSTLLKVLSRITEPTEGHAVIRGRVSSLLEVGTGFHPELTGRENVYMNGTILGMTKREIDGKFDRIVDFSGVEKFIDTPIKRYSSGMKVRLAFSVAAHLEPDILLIDEVLAVGDAEFQNKCLGKMGQVAREGRTVVFVSHNMAAVVRLCTRVMWLDGGRIRRFGYPEEIVPDYLTSAAAADGYRVWENGIANRGKNRFRLFAASVLTDAGEKTSTIAAHRPFFLEFEFEILEPIPHCRIGFILYTADGIAVFEACDLDDARLSGRRQPGRYKVRCEVPGHLLNPGRYVITIKAGVPKVESFVLVESALVLDVQETGSVGSHVRGSRAGVIRPALRWERETVGGGAPTVQSAAG